MALRMMIYRYRRIAVVRIPMMSSIRIWIRHFLRQLMEVQVAGMRA